MAACIDSMIGTLISCPLTSSPKSSVGTMTLPTCKVQQEINYEQTNRPDGQRKKLRYSEAGAGPSNQLRPKCPCSATLVLGRADLG